MEMYIRILIALLIILTLVAVSYIFNRWQRRKANGCVKGLALQAGRPAVIYFHSPACSVCQTGQKPILDSVRAKSGADDYQWVTIDASAQVDVSWQWGIRTLPTTCIVNEIGEVTHINNGLVTEGELLRQLFRLNG